MKNIKQAEIEPGHAQSRETMDDSEVVITLRGQTPAPSISSINPMSGPPVGGTDVTITGQNFVSGVQVRFGGVDALSVTFFNSTQLIARTPATTTAGFVNVRVINPDGQVAVLQSAFEYRLAPAPTLSFINPTSGPLAGGPM